MESKSIALPLGYNPLIKGRYMRLELMYAGATNRCVNQLHQYRQNITGIVGIEPTPTVLETVVLPLNYIPITNGREWIRTTEPEGADLQSAAFSQTSLPFHKWRGTESNCRHMELQSIALPTELPSHYTVLTGLEPVISCVTGRRDNQLHHRTNCGRRI